jgi:transketolase
MSAVVPMPAGDAPAAMFDCRHAFADELVHLARTDARVVAVCNDSVGSSNLTAFKKEFPDRLINVGIAEQNMVGVSAGLANGGLRPFVCAAAPFLSGRATEQIKTDIAYSHVPVVLCGLSPGVAYGALGPTHHSIEDLSWMRAISDLDVVVPCDPDETREVMRSALASGRPTYMRVGRILVPAVAQGASTFRIGRFRLVRPGNDVALIAAGTMVSRALAAAGLLASHGIAARVLNAASVQPIDEEAVLAAARETRGIITVEEAIVRGGLGAAVAEIVVQRHPVPMRLMGLTGFAPTGSAELLLSHFGLTADGIAERARELIG